ncbi:Cyclic nucleotide-binding domain-containing protein [Maridesulfovibrio ferrireducens]|uniref:Cyclic nucleotide-binding domain-containing protein n=1 Tax=Maridesulfovibrio ferrireducens TaxID=246191 RepID=A0A1G9JMJ5_9BACT|nr:cyclic nucleotide-binding domain-containing protein [Maridesulfovibrio ferrireducens]SDL38671.1 Cyclic nucleotide-binding domain-containing protein [Maridesulfovibrio ferrireducens]
MSVETSEYQEHLEIIREVPYFSGLELEAQKLLAYLCVRETFAPGETVFNTGDVDQSAYFILKGQMEAFLDGVETPIQTFKDNDFVGALTLIGDSKRLFTLKATSESVCVRLTKDKFEKAREQYPEISNKFLKAAVNKISNREERFIAKYDIGCEGCKSTIGLTLI